MATEYRKEGKSGKQQLQQDLSKFHNEITPLIDDKPKNPQFVFKILEYFKHFFCVSFVILEQENFSSTRRKYFFYTYKIIFLRVGVNAPSGSMQTRYVGRDIRATYLATLDPRIS